MSSVAITCRRTLSHLRNLLPTAVAEACFLAASSGLLAFRMVEAEGSRQLLSVLWASSVAPFLPILAALLGMDAWSDERRTRRLDILLSTAVRERELVVGKFLGVFAASVVSIILSLVMTVGLLLFLAPTALSDVDAVVFLPALAVLFLQGALWCAVSVAISSLSRWGFVSACLTCVLLVGLPRGGWVAAQFLSSAGRTAFGEFPLDAQVVDFASGIFSTGVIVAYVSLTVLALFFASKVIALSRFVGRRATVFRASTALVLALALICVAAIVQLAMRLDLTLDLPIGPSPALSPQLRQILAESSGQVTITAFHSRHSPTFRALAQSLRVLKRQATSVGGLELNLRFVDSRWDIGAADRLVRLGAKEPSVVFEKGYRVSILSLKDGYEEGLLASALRRVVLPPQRQDVYWTVGHGESAIDAYGVHGLSDIARELVRNGYRNRTIDLSEDRAIPSDCALIIVAGAKDSFSRIENGRIDAYLKGGGRLLVLMGSSGEGGISSLLSTWGLRTVPLPLVGSRTLSGSDVIVRDFAEHPVTDGLEGSRLILERPLAFVSSAAAQSGTGADRLEFTPIAKVSSSAVVAAIERGNSVGSDLAVRPTRLIVIGDPTFVVNGQLTARANANRDFFLNAVAYLSGAEVTGLVRTPSMIFLTGMDRVQRAHYAFWAVLGLPGSVFVVMVLVMWRRRNRA